jgi:hypothetical protein
MAKNKKLDCSCNFCKLKREEEWEHAGYIVAMSLLTGVLIYVIAIG